MPDGQNYKPPIADLYDAKSVIAHLYDAGSTLVTLWGHGVRPSDGGAGTAISWIQMIPDSNVHWKQVVGFRILKNPRTDKPIMSWKMIALELELDAAVCERIFKAAIDLIVAELNRKVSKDANKLEAHDR